MDAVFHDFGHKPRMSRRLKAACIGCAILVVSVFHWITPTGQHDLLMFHVVLRKLFVLPVVMAAIWFELPGAVIAAAVITAAYAPRIIFQWSGSWAENINQFGEVATVWVMALLSGIFVRIDKSALRQVAATNQGALVAMVSALDAREHNTELHSLRVRDYALRIGRELGLLARELTLLGQAALLHDVGKIGIPDRVLLKRGPLNEQEWQLMRKHPSIGRRILSSVPFLSKAAEVVYAHHERYDGTGYPRGLRGDRIPLLARVFAVADVLDALTSARPYRSPVDWDTAQNIIRD